MTSCRVGVVNVIYMRKIGSLDIKLSYKDVYAIYKTFHSFSSHRFTSTGALTVSLSLIHLSLHKIASR